LRHQLVVSSNQNEVINLPYENPRGQPITGNHQRWTIAKILSPAPQTADRLLRSSFVFVTMFPGKKVQASRNSLGKGLDSKILNYVREFNQVQLDSASGGKRPGVLQLYTLLQERDAQLRRVKKVQLEASIQRALGILQSEIVIDSEGESFDSDFEGIEDLNLIEVKVVSPFVDLHIRIRMH
jgi:hypothetical protein